MFTLIAFGYEVITLLNHTASHELSRLGKQVTLR